MSQLPSEHHSLLVSVAEQLLTALEVVVGDQRLRVTRVGTGRLRTVRFTANGRAIQAIEQNPEKPSRWGQLARRGHRVVQFQDVETRKYLAVAVDGNLTEYGRS